MHIDGNSVNGHLHVMFRFNKLTEHDKYHSKWEGTATWTGSYHSRIVVQGGGKVAETINRTGSGGKTVHAAFILTFPEQMGGSPSKQGCWNLDFPTEGDEAPAFNIHGNDIKLYGGSTPVTGSMDAPGAVAIDHLEGAVPADGMIQGSWSAHVSWVAMATPVEPPACHEETDKSAGDVAMNAELKQMIARQKKAIDQATHQEQQETSARLPKLSLRWNFSPEKSDLYVDIYNHGVRITGKTVHAVVGEQISLKGDAAIQGLPITSRHWVLGGRPIATWNASKDHAEVKAIKPGDYLKKAIVFYWWKPGTYRVRYIVHSGGKNYYAHSTFVIARPDIRLYARTSPGLSGVLVDIRNKLQPDDPYVGNLAYVPDNGHTIIFDRTRIPSAYPGITEFVQLIKTEGYVYQDPNFGACKAEHDKEYLLDTNYPYNVGSDGKVYVNAPETYDSPGRDVFTWTNDIDIAMTFKTYLMYKPGKPHSIFVPISYLPWWWHGIFHHDKNARRKIKEGERRHHEWLIHSRVSVMRAHHVRSRPASAYPVWNAVTPNPMPACDEKEEKAMKDGGY